MFFLNLTGLEFFALLGSLGSLVTALYLFDRRRRKRTVATLRFWNAQGIVEQRRSRRHMQQPWSLLLQLLGLVLLLLAIAQVQWGTRPGRGRDHVLLLDTSVWSGARLPDGRLVLDRERALAQAFLKGLPQRDRALIVGVDATAMPVGFWSRDRNRQFEQLNSLQPAVSSLDLAYGLRFAETAAKWSELAGEVIYFGPGRTMRPPKSVPSNLRVVSVPSASENIGIRGVEITRGAETSDWKATLILRNDGAQTTMVRLETAFEEARFATRQISLGPDSEEQVHVTFTTRVPGLFRARIASVTSSQDSISADNQTEVALPASAPVELIAYTTRPALWRPLLEAGRELRVRYLDPAQYRADERAQVLLFDGFTPRQRPSAPALYVNPERSASPLPVRTSAHNVRLNAWSAEGLRAIGSDQTGLREKELHFPEARVFETFQGDITLASIPEGPVIVARNGNGRAAHGLVAIGFDLLNTGLHSDLTVPLLLANLLHWLSPSAFSPGDYTAQHVGPVSVPLEPAESPASVRVTNDEGQPIPFTIRHGNLQLFADRVETAHVISGFRERVLSLSLPDVALDAWQPPHSVSTGLPSPVALRSNAVDLWQWLALAAAVAFVIEWILFGRTRRISARTRGRVSNEDVRRSAVTRERIPA